MTLGAQGSPITKMVSVGGRLWCGCQNRVLVLSPDTLQLEVVGMWVGLGACDRQLIIWQVISPEPKIGDPSAPLFCVL